MPEVLLLNPEPTLHQILLLTAVRGGTEATEVPEAAAVVVAPEETLKN
jgi:hypothetical protein